MRYSQDVRKKAVEYVLKGNSRRKTAKIFQVNHETIGERVKKYKETGEIKDREIKRKPKKIDPEKPEKYIEEHPDAYLREIAQVFNCTPVAVHNRLKKLGITRKKQNLYKEQKEQGVKEYLSYTLHKRNIMSIEKGNDLRKKR